MIHNSLFSSSELLARKFKSQNEKVLLARFMDGTLDANTLLKMANAYDVYWSPFAYFLVSALLAMAEDLPKETPSLGEDRSYTRCEECKQGMYVETRLQDDWWGTLHCDVCGHEVNRWTGKDK